MKSWGNTFLSNPTATRYLDWSCSDFAVDRPSLAIGQRRSYGDSCLISDGVALMTENTDRVLAFDPVSGILKAEAGCTLETILQIAIPAGWFLPVTPGTKFVSLGGAVCNDVHGKNHHVAGSFGCHVLSFELLRSNGERLQCSPTSQSEMFQATIGGLGLTGLITWVEIQMAPIASSRVRVSYFPFSDLDEFVALSVAKGNQFEFSVAWIDSLSGGKRTNGILMCGSFPSQGPLEVTRPRSRTLPVYLPQFALNRWTVQAFNKIYYAVNRGKGSFEQSYDSFFYPLDAIAHWNRGYGRVGFFQYQCVVPLDESGVACLRKVLELAHAAGQGSFLSVIKLFGSRKSPGLLSFPRSGITLCLDFPNRGTKTLELFEKFDHEISKVGGALYPAKDARMSKSMFLASFPNWAEFQRYRDFFYVSDFLKRLNL